MKSAELHSLIPISIMTSKIRAVSPFAMTAFGWGKECSCAAPLHRQGLAGEACPFAEVLCILCTASDGCIPFCRGRRARPCLDRRAE